MALFIILSAVSAAATISTTSKDNSTASRSRGSAMQPSGETNTREQVLSSSGENDIRSGDFLQFTPGMLRKLFAQPFCLVVGVLDRAIMGIGGRTPKEFPKYVFQPLSDLLPAYVVT